MIRALIVFIVLCFFTCLGITIIFMLEILETAAIGDAYFFHESNIATAGNSLRRLLSE